MKIAQIAPLYESTPPKLYGGTERVVAYLTEELVAQGHDVTLFASGDSETAATLIPCCEEALRLNAAIKDAIPYYVIMLEEVRRRARDFDILHFHIDCLHFPLMRGLPDVAAVTTLHGRLDLPDLQPFYRAFPDLPLVSISYSQRAPMPPVAWAGTVLHGLPPATLPFTERPRGNYLAFLGRISPEKGPDDAIRIAQAAGIPLKIAAKVGADDRKYWEETIEPMIAADPAIEYIGEINEAQKGAFLGEAAALLFPIAWPEPFGLVMIEAMACGTPTVAFRHGSVPEVIDDGVSGFIVETVDQAATALPKALRLDRRGIRDCFERRFTAARMAGDYLALYERLAGGTRARQAGLMRS